MSIVVAHQTSPSGRAALQEAAKEAYLRGLQLAIVHVAEGLDRDLVDTHQTEVKGEITRELAAINLQDTDWTLTVTAGVDVGETVLDAASNLDATLLVIGARRRSPVGKLFLGSVTQNIILNASAPVLVVKAADGK